MSAPIPVRKVTVRRCAFVLNKHAAYSDGSRDPDYTLLWAEVGDGSATGYGECISTSLSYPPGHIGRSAVDEWSELRGLAGALVGKDARRLGQLLPDSILGHDHNSVVDALDFALHDFLGRKLGVPVATLLGGAARPSVCAMTVIHTDTPDAMAKDAADFHRRLGLRWFKLKPIGHLEGDVETLRKIRERIASPVHVWADANYALKMRGEELHRYMDAVHAEGLEVYEDPVDTDFAGYAALRKRMKPKLMLDDKVRSPGAVIEALAAGAADYVNIHANWAGGFQAGLAKARVAAAGGVPCLVGSTYYFGPGAAAYQALASVLPLDAPCEQLDVRHYGERSLARDPYEMRDGKILIRDAPGLGVSPNLDALETVTLEKETFN